MTQTKSRWWISSDLLAALERGVSFSEWLDGRTPVASAARISKDRKGDAHGVAHQHLANERTAGRNNLAIVKYYEDNDKSAAREDVRRDAFEHLVTEICRRRTGEGFSITGVICLETERLYRRAGDYERIVDALMADDDGVLYESGDGRDRCIDLYSDSAEFEGLIGVARAKSEIRKTARRMRDSHTARALQGAAIGGPRRFGWLQQDISVGRRSNDKKNPVEWPILQEMIRDGAMGKSWTTIAEDLNARGILTARGNKWRSSGVRDSVANPHVCGYRIMRGELVRDPNGAPVIGTWDKPGTVQQWEAIRERVQQARGQKGLPVEDPDYTPGSFATRSRKYLYSMFLVCGRKFEDGNVCNAPMRGARKKNHKCGGYKHYYHCSPRGDGGCGIGRDGAKVDRYLTELVLQKHEQLAASHRPIPVKGWDGEQELADVQARKARLKREWHAGNVADDDYFEDLPELDGKIRELRKEQRKHLATQERRATLGGNDIRKRWDGMDLAQRRAAIREVLVAVIVSPLPRGAQRNGPFDPSLLRPIWRSHIPDEQRGRKVNRSAA